MKSTKHLVPALAVLTLAILLSGCSDTRRASPKVIGVDIRHGNVWPGLTETLTAAGYKVVVMEQDINAESLKPLGILFSHSPDKPFADDEINAISKFVRSGGGFIGAGQAWSWTYKEYGNKPIETYPLNMLGKKLGFTVTSQTVGTPTYFATDVMTGISLVERSDWWPSAIECSSRDCQSIIRDEQQRSMGAMLSYGRGRITIYGHGELLKDNPAVLLNTVKYVSRQP